MGSSCAITSKRERSLIDARCMKPIY
jgi:hypothetical protein